MTTSPIISKGSSFNKISIGLVSPEVILDRSSGEVIKPETINYRTHKPEPGGLFCERIFGPQKDYECSCGKYKLIRYRGIVCDRCGVEVTLKSVRRERTGHIRLVVPVVHIWYYKAMSNRVGHLLGLKAKDLEKIIYYERYVVVQPGIAVHPETGEPLAEKDFLTEEEVDKVMESLPQENKDLPDDHPDKLVLKMGAECIHYLLKKIDLKALSEELRMELKNTKITKQNKSTNIKRLEVVESFMHSQKRRENKPEWMVIPIIPVMPPELRPLVPLDGGRFASSDLNDLYRRVIIRNNRLKKLTDIKAPELILRNEKRMLQEAVDSLFDNTKKASAIKSDSNRPLKSLSESLKGKQGRFRQNLLGKRVDYSARSVIVVGPELHMHECGLPKEIAAELYKPFVVRKLIERGLCSTVKSAKRFVDKRDPVIWDILENILWGHPVLLNRAPTLHRLGIQAFQPKMIEGRAIQLHPLVCTAFNADFDGDQMAVYLPLTNEAILEAQILMLASNNILNPANGAPVTVPSQDMILGLYYLTKSKKDFEVVKPRFLFSSEEEAAVACHQKVIDLWDKIGVRIWNEQSKSNEVIETTFGRVKFNEVTPLGFPFVNKTLTKKAIRDVISEMLWKSSISVVSKFLDDIKTLGFETAFKGGISFSLENIVTPDDKKQELVSQAEEEVADIMESYNAGMIGGNERHNRIIDTWSSANTMLRKVVVDKLEKDEGGFNPIYMMLDSGARGSREQIGQLAGMRGLMAKPKKSASSIGQIIEDPILANFKEGLSILEYFISTHGARKGLADTALKTADAGYLTRRLVDVSQDVIITNEDCGTLRGLTLTALLKNQEEVEPLYDRILGRYTSDVIYYPNTHDRLVDQGIEITEEVAQKIIDAKITAVKVRSPLTCDNKEGVCVFCYGRNLATNRIAHEGEAVGVIASQSIGEPGTQLTLRTFHVGGTATKIAEEPVIKAVDNSIVEVTDIQLVRVSSEQKDEQKKIVLSRTAELTLRSSESKEVIASYNIPYGAEMLVENGMKVKKDQELYRWDPYNASIIAEDFGTLRYDNIELGVNLRTETDAQVNIVQKVIVESKGKRKQPSLVIVDEVGEVITSYNLPVGSVLLIDDNTPVYPGATLVKISRNTTSSGGDITGGLPRVTELFEARNPSLPAVVSEIDGVVSFGRIIRNNQEVTITSRYNDTKTYLVKLSSQMLVQQHDYVKAGQPISQGAVAPKDILAIKGVAEVQKYLVDEVQDVYRGQGVKINDKHFESIIRQMIQKVEILDGGDTKFLESAVVHKADFMEENDRIFGHKIVEMAGDSQKYKEGDVISTQSLRSENQVLSSQDKETLVVREVKPAIAVPMLQGITRAALQTNSFISAASFQETTKILNEAAIKGKVDFLSGLKENVIVGKKIPVGTGLKKYDKIVVASKA